MSFIPRFKLYASDGITLLYTFTVVQETNAPQSPFRNIVIEGVRGKGCLVIPAGTASWDLEIKGYLTIDGAVEGYKELTVKIDALESAVQLNTNYYLKIDKTESTTYSYKVRRIEPIEYPQSLRTDSQEYVIKFKVNSW